MNQIQTNITPIVAHDAVTALPAVPTSCAYVDHWNARGVPEFDIEVWAAGSTNLTVAEMLAGIPHPLVIADDTFTAEADDEKLTAVAHGLQTGDGPIQLTTSGVLPAGLSLLTDYWVIKFSADVIYLAASRELALAGTKITFTTDGTGTHTLSDTATTSRIHWSSIGLLGPAGAGAIELTATKGYMKRLPHHSRTVAYAMVATLSAAVATSVNVSPVVEV
jgi:hypothetical protein